MCDAEPKPRQNAIVGVCIALAVVVIAVIGVPYMLLQSNIDRDAVNFQNVTQLDDGDTLGVFFPVVVVIALCLISWLIIIMLKLPEEQQIFDPPV